jgi:hypothetical protein
MSVTDQMIEASRQRQRAEEAEAKVDQLRVLLDEILQFGIDHDFSCAVSMWERKKTVPRMPNPMPDCDCGLDAWYTAVHLALEKKS